MASPNRNTDLSWAAAAMSSDASWPPRTWSRSRMTGGRADDVVAAEFRRGAAMIAAALETSGGGWSASEAMVAVQITRPTLRRWQNTGRLLAITLSDGAVVYPRAQCVASTNGHGPLCPSALLVQITRRLLAQMTPEELFVLLATPTPMLAGPDRQPQTVFAALGAGDVASVLALIDWVATPADAGAPLARASRRDDST